MKQFKQIPQDSKPTKRRFSRFLKFGLILVVVAVVTEVWIVNRLSSYGEEIKNLEQVEAQLQLENQILENEIAKIGSLKSVEQRAESLGFSPIKNLVYIKE